MPGRNCLQKVSIVEVKNAMSRNCCLSEYFDHESYSVILVDCRQRKRRLCFGFFSVSSVLSVVKMSSE
jgi:hypothetical protein